LSGRRRVLFDLQATQSVDQRHRGIPRYVADLAFAIEEIAPEAVERYLLNPDLAVPEAHIAARLLDAGKLHLTDDVDWAAADLLHIASPLEMTRPGHRLLPPGARTAGLPWAVTFYDLIPQLMPDYYLEDPGLRRRYRARLQLVRTAAAVLTLSEATRADVVEHLGLDPGRVFVVGAGTSSRFVPPASRPEAAAAAAGAVAGLRNPYVFYIGSYEKRKNLEPLLEAWARLPEAVRRRWQLALCCPLKPLERNHLLHRAAALGVTDSVCLTGFVTDDVLLLLHQGADLFVFPSIYEGYGLPVAEALACGAPVLGADASSLPEILAPEALFDATSPETMATAIERGLTDEPFRRRLLAAAGKAPTSWTEVASATVAAYEEVLDRLAREGAPTGGGRPGGRPDSRRRVAFAGPVGPGAGPVGDWNRALVDGLAGRTDLDVAVFAERSGGDAGDANSSATGDGLSNDSGAVPGMRVHPLAALDAVEGLHGPFDAVVHSLADDGHHRGSLAALRRRGDGIVVAHDARLAGLYADAARAGALPGGLGPAIRAAYGAAVLPGVGDDGLEPGEARRLGVLLARDAIGHSRRFLVTSEPGAELAGLDAPPADRAKVGVIDADPSGAAAVLHAVITTSGDPAGDPARDPAGGPWRDRRHRARPSGPVLYDLQATQSVDQRHRGIARYVLDLALALEDAAPGHVGAYLVNPDLALPEEAELFVAAGKLRASDEIDWDAARLLHIGSLFEMGVPLRRLLPPAARAAGVPWAVTFHDLIPLLMPESYLEDPGRARRYRARIQLLRAADAVLTNSRATRADALAHLGLEPERVVVAGTGTHARFVPPASRADAAAAAAKALPGLRPPFVFYVGSYDRRKNLEPFLEAWSLLGPGLRNRYQLVVSAIPDPLERNHLLHRAERLGIARGLYVTGFIPDDVLLLLYQGTELFVFPSLYEGYGLPVAEARACGAPVLAADSSSLPEIVGPDALFDPTDPAAMAAAVERGLTDDRFRRSLLDAAGRPPTTWADVAAATVAVHDRLLAGTRPPERAGRRPTRRRVAVCAALPPDGGDRAGANRALVEALGRRADVDVHAFADRPTGAGRARRTPAPIPGVTVHPLAALDAVEEYAGPFDAVVYVLADDVHHTGCMAALRRRRDGIVVAHDAYLSDLYGHAERSGALPQRIGAVVRAAYGDLVASGFDADEPVTATEARRLGILLARDAVACSRLFLTAGPGAAALVRLDARAGDRAKVEGVAVTGGADDHGRALGDRLYEWLAGREPAPASAAPA